MKPPRMKGLNPTYVPTFLQIIFTVSSYMTQNKVKSFGISLNYFSCCLNYEPTLDSGDRRIRMRFVEHIMELSTLAVFFMIPLQSKSVRNHTSITSVVLNLYICNLVWLWGTYSEFINPEVVWDAGFLFKYFFYHCSLSYLSILSSETCGIQDL